ncbi:MAG: alanine racemase [Omnitrophica bacterium RBG_13_46_9]|nr:MAG: alanine racemase [Omnitrophica bacterium RBG_13_46_9]
MKSNMTYRPTWAEIDLGAIRYNQKSIQSILGTRSKIMAVVKANAYGHGIVEVSKVLEGLKITYLGVATLDEALVLRKANIRLPILILGSVLPGESEAAVKNNITLTLCNKELLGAFKDLAKKRLSPKVHVKVDTGMGRIGVWHEDAIEFIINAKNECRNLDIEGIYTHFSIAGRDKFFTQYQIDSFEGILSGLKELGISVPFRHAANSIAVVDWKKSHLNMVRPGIIIYGIYPKRNFPRLINLKPALSLKTKIVFLKDVPPGRSISYGRTYITQRDTKIATLPIGYADGYGRILSNKAEVLIRGQRAPVIGKVTMDQTMVDVGHVKYVKVGDEVVLIGKQKQEEIRVERLARLSGTIPYEIITGITSRVPRRYKNQS